AQKIEVNAHATYPRTSASAGGRNDPRRRMTQRFSWKIRTGTRMWNARGGRTPTARRTQATETHSASAMKARRSRKKEPKNARFAVSTSPGARVRPAAIGDAIVKDVRATWRSVNRATRGAW